ncbi:hypothetical protein CLIB1444_02S04170 [[Candida] jaroonii]|uniref:Uncharacterized protein n=1 Tax=[Candida] jaroonii TaxID=467808 RepID=A0ACA9Y2R3_9ASCO|nr:hypothetical protein CLIB1444_02S04170 [[Candida] jaroonii]
MKLIWRFILLVYVTTYISSIPWNFLLHRFNKEVSNNWFNSLINSIFVEDYGYVWFSLTFLAYGMKPDFQFKMDQNNIKLIKIYVSNVVFGIFINYWFFGPSIVERIDTYKGGYCELVSRALSHGSCNAQSGVWHSVFDASGHYYLIISMSLLLWDRYLQAIVDDEVINDNSIINLEEGFTLPEPIDPMFIKFRIFLHIFTISLISIWYFEFIITSLFFHTPFEKLVGLMFGMVVPLIAHFYTSEKSETHTESRREVSEGEGRGEDISAEIREQDER